MALKTNSPFLTNTQTLKQCYFFFRTSVSRLGQEFPKSFVKNKIFLNLGFTKKKQILESVNASDSDTWNNIISKKTEQIVFIIAHDFKTQEMDDL